MQTAQAIWNHHLQEAASPRGPSSARVSSGWLARIFGCWHRDLSRPITQEGKTKRVCLDCGAQRQFNIETWEMVGSFYYERPAARKVSEPDAPKAFPRKKSSRMVLVKAAA